MPTDLPPAQAACCGSILRDDCGHNAIRDRLRAFLCALGHVNPSQFVTGDFWRPLTLQNAEAFGDDRPEVWARIVEGLEVLQLTTRTRYYQESVGVMFKTVIDLWLPDYWGIQVGDHFEAPHAVSYRVEEVRTEIEGIATLRIEQAASRFTRPPRTEPVYRFFGAGARIL